MNFFEKYYFEIFALLGIPCWINHINFFLVGEWWSPFFPVFAVAIGMALNLFAGALVIAIFPLFSILWILSKIQEIRGNKVRPNTNALVHSNTNKAKSWLELLKRSADEQKDD